MSKKTNPFYEKWDEIVEYLWDKDSPILKMKMKGELFIKLMCPTMMITLDESLDNDVYDDDDDEVEVN